MELKASVVHFTLLIVRQKRGQAVLSRPRLQCTERDMEVYLAEILIPEHYCQLTQGGTAWIIYSVYYFFGVSCPILLANA